MDNVQAGELFTEVALWEVGPNVLERQDVLFQVHLETAKTS